MHWSVNDIYHTCHFQVKFDAFPHTTRPSFMVLSPAVAVTYSYQVLLFQYMKKNCVCSFYSVYLQFQHGFWQYLLLLWHEFLYMFLWLLHYLLVCFCFCCVLSLRKIAIWLSKNCQKLDIFFKKIDKNCH